MGVTGNDDSGHQLFDAINEKFKTMAQEAEKETIEVAPVHNIHHLHLEVGIQTNRIVFRPYHNQCYEL